MQLNANFWDKITMCKYKQNSNKRRLLPLFQNLARTDEWDFFGTSVGRQRKFTEFK